MKTNEQYWKFFSELFSISDDAKPDTVKFMQSRLTFGYPLEFDGYHVKKFSDPYDEAQLQQRVIQEFLDDIESEIEKSNEFLHFKKNINVYVYSN